ncbi:uncharacterized protein LOC110988399 [Acanthaster planci]|uniref:Uncharacterized protein LOC110988399 n=1 Tax=Acanthaster planci TaxID=133434 RepID=A0A8B7ZVI8_ACAPL|nr:uncharacterized protein LOC110988399 [Acanthaster planci]XP_022107541.1 uncharacterized protein LOC110988399 [Acanthaster planci]
MQFAYVKDNLPKNWSLMIMDSSKNRRIFYQDEIKSPHYCQTQVTIHPVIMYYNNRNTLVRDSLIFLTDDIVHDYHTIQLFLKLASHHLSKQIKTTREVIWFEGCQSQYKGRGTFADLSLSSKSRELNYFGAEYIEGEGDREIAVVNKAVDQAILGRKVVINSAQELWQWCSDNLATDTACSKRRFVYVAPTEIQRDRPLTEIATVKGWRGFHQLQVAGPYKLLTRRLSCFCPSCLIGQEQTCFNAEHTGRNFQQKCLQLRRKHQTVTDVLQIVKTEDCAPSKLSAVQALLFLRVHRVCVLHYVNHKIFGHWRILRNKCKFSQSTCTSFVCAVINKQIIAIS